MKIKKRGFQVISFLVIFFLALTMLVEWTGEVQSDSFGTRSATQNALVVYDPDPFYNLDEQVSKSFAKGLAEEKWLVSVKSVAAANQSPNDEYDLYVFCANTYNFAPDRAVKNFIKNHNNLITKPTIAITLGSGSTKQAQRKLENLIKEKEANLLDSRTYWLMRPNDESRMEESNVQVAVNMAYEFGKEVAQKMKATYSQK